ncbi:hypothetical protein [Pantoea agglomerans]|uniref:hypothetical protein n=2 Tax=Enterobacter agglomerans TaxID=549 RepID=UPI003C7DFC94
MKTEYLELSEHWVLIKDDLQDYDVLVETGSALFCVSDTVPDDETQAGHTVNAGNWLKFSGELLVWVKTRLAGSAISVSSYDPTSAW